MSISPTVDIEAQAIIAWWRALYPDEATGRRGDAGARAALRRAESPFHALLLPACHDLLRLMRDRGAAPGELTDARLKRIAMAAILLCQCRDSRTGPASFASVLGASKDGERAVLAPLRFQTLMAAMDRDEDAEQIKALRRAMTLAKDTPFNVTGFVRDLLLFGDQTRIRWTFDYYGAAREAAPAPVSETEDTLS